MSSAGRCGSPQPSRYLPSKFSSVLVLALSVPSSPPRVTRRYRFSPGLAEIRQRSSPRFMAGSASEPPISSSSWASIWACICASRSAASGLMQITNRSCSLIHTSFDPHVPGDVGVAALAGQRGLDLGRSGAQGLPDDVIVITRPQVPAVLR